MRYLRLEWKKLPIKFYLCVAAGLFVFSLFIGLLFLFLPAAEMDSEDVVFSTSWGGLIVMVSSISMFEFSVMGAVVHGKGVLDEYMGRKVLLLFSYPVRREVLFWVKIAVSGGFTAAITVAANLVAVLTVGLVADIGLVMPEFFGIFEIIQGILYSLFVAVGVEAISLISLWFGFLRQSLTAGIIAALILAILITQVFAMNLVWNMGMLLLIAIVVVFGAGSFCSLERKIRNMEVV